MTSEVETVRFSAERGCGQRKKGGVYLTVPESPLLTGEQPEPKQLEAAQ